jgi:hypothetical protein
VKSGQKTWTQEDVPHLLGDEAHQTRKHEQFSDLPEHPSFTDGLCLRVAHLGGMQEALISSGSGKTGTEMNNEKYIDSIKLSQSADRT